MRTRLLALLSLLVASNAAQAGTLYIRSFLAPTTGVAIVDHSGAAIAVGGAYAYAGTFDEGVNFNTMSAETLAGMFNPVNPTALGLWSGGLFNGEIYDDTTLPIGFAGEDAYVVVINTASLGTATTMAVYNTNSIFLDSPTQNFITGTPGNWVYGRPLPVSGTIFLANGNPTSIVNGIAMHSVPEPSALLLGFLATASLLRRRR